MPDLKYFVAFSDGDGGGVEDFDTREDAEKRAKEMEDDVEINGCIIQGIIKGIWIKDA